MSTQEQKFNRKVKRILKSPAQPPPHIGTQRMRKEARRRHAEWQYGDTWKVSGGESDHVVVAGQYNRPETFSCDCNGIKQSSRHLCCHILAVMWEM